jgi:hypothetical protein
MKVKTEARKPAASLLLAMVLMLGAPLVAGSARSGPSGGTLAQPGPIDDCGSVPIDGVDDALFARVVLPSGELAIHVIDPARGQPVCRLPFGVTVLSPDGRTLFLGHQTLRDGQAVIEVIAVERATGSILRVYEVTSEQLGAATDADRLPHPPMSLALDGRTMHVLAVQRDATPSGLEVETSWRSDLFALDLESGQVPEPLPVAGPIQALRYWPELIASPDGYTLFVVERIFTPNDQPAGSELWEDRLSLVRSTTIRTDTLTVEHVATGSLAGTDAGGDARFATCGLGYEGPLAARPDGSALYSFCQGGLYGLAAEPLPAVVRFFDPATLRETGRIELAEGVAAGAATVAVPSPDGTLLYVVGVTEEERSIHVVDLARASLVRSAALTPGVEPGHVGRLTAWLGRTLAPAAVAKGLWPTVELAPDGRRLLIAAGETGISEVDLTDLRVTRNVGGEAQYLDLAFSASASYLVALGPTYDLTVFPTGDNVGRTVENGLQAEPLFNEVLFP